MSAVTRTATADLRYPVGQFDRNARPSATDRARHIEEIAAAPARLREAVRGLSEEQLSTPYRPGGWAVRQVVHHLPDSHLNAYVRFKLALTENKPTICPYDEKRWAELDDTRRTPISTSLDLLEALHQRWVVLLRSIAPADFARKFVHPEMGELDLDTYAALYAWHGRHHVAHITGLRQRAGW